MTQDGIFNEDNSFVEERFHPKSRNVGAKGARAHLVVSTMRVSYNLEEWRGKGRLAHGVYPHLWWGGSSPGKGGGQNHGVCELGNQLCGPLSSRTPVILLGA